MCLPYVMITIPSYRNCPGKLSIIAIIASNHFRCPYDLLFTTSRRSAIDSTTGKWIQQEYY